MIYIISVQNIRFREVVWGERGGERSSTERRVREERGERRGEGHVFSIWLPGGGNVYLVLCYKVCQYVKYWPGLCWPAGQQPVPL